MTIRFPKLSDVRLLPGTPFYDRQRNMNEYLLGVNDDSMLYNFRSAAGLPTAGAAPLRGWDADECKLKGHSTGHYMSGLALALVQTGDIRFRGKLEYIVSGLAECQEAFGKQPDCADGFLSAYSEEQFDLLEQGAPYPEIWAPYYTLDKIMSGLLDAYELADIKQSLDILCPLGSWVYNRLVRLSDEKRHAMWDTYIAGEYGCMMVTMVRLYRLTGKPEHLEAARFFENPALFDQMESGCDRLDGMHANQHIPQIMGALELYEASGDERYLSIAENFFDIVSRHHCYAIGGTGEQERFRAADAECSLLTESTCESCASYNMLRLASRLLELAPDERTAGYRTNILAYYENILFNHILASFSHKADGATTYFMPLEPGSARHYDGDDDNSCCHGTGLETRYRYVSRIFSYSAEYSGECPAERSDKHSVVHSDEQSVGLFDEGLSGSSGGNSDEYPDGCSVVSSDDISTETLRIELPVSAELRGEEELTLKYTEDGQLVISARRDMKRRIALRIPLWAENFITESRAEFKGGYLWFKDLLRKGGSINVYMPMELRSLPVLSDADFVNIAWGPYLLAAISNEKEPLRAPDTDKKNMQPDPERPGVFIADGTTYMPLYLADTAPCHVYMKRR